MRPSDNVDVYQSGTLSAGLDGIDAIERAVAIAELDAAPRGHPEQHNSQAVTGVPADERPRSGCRSGECERPRGLGDFHGDLRRGVRQDGAGPVAGRCCRCRGQAVAVAKVDQEANQRTSTANPRCQPWSSTRSRTSTRATRASKTALRLPFGMLTTSRWSRPAARSRLARMASTSIPPRSRLRPLTKTSRKATKTTCPT